MTMVSLNFKDKFEIIMYSTLSKHRQIKFNLSKYNELQEYIPLKLENVLKTLLFLNKI
jgi:hypothetical protein